MTPRSSGAQMTSSPAPAQPTSPEPRQPESPAEPHCLVERRGAVLVVTMNRPAARNALSGPMMAIMRSAWDEVDADPEIRVCVLTGAGGAFCAGADLKAMVAAPPGESFSAGGPDL